MECPLAQSRSRLSVRRSGEDFVLLNRSGESFAAAFFADVDAEFRSTWQGGGRVMVFDVLEPTNWNAPWFILTRAGLSKDKLRGFLESHYTVVPQNDIARLKVWEIRPR